MGRLLHSQLLVQTGRVSTALLVFLVLRRGGHRVWRPSGQRNLRNGRRPRSEQLEMDLYPRRHPHHPHRDRRLFPRSGFPPAGALVDARGENVCDGESRNERERGAERSGDPQEHFDVLLGHQEHSWRDHVFR